MKNILSNNKGVTLIEILVSFAIMSMVMILITTIFVFGQNQYKNQSAHAQSQGDVRLAMNILTKEIRSADPAKVRLIVPVTSEDVSKEITIGDNPNKTRIKFEESNGTVRLIKNGNVLIDQLNGSFKPLDSVVDAEEDHTLPNGFKNLIPSKIEIFVESNTSDVDQSTIIYLRK